MELSTRATIGATFGIIFCTAIGAAFREAFEEGIGAAFGAAFRAAIRVAIGAAIGAALGAAIGFAINVQSAQPSAHQSTQLSVQPSAPPLVHFYLSKTDIDEMIKYLNKQQELDKMDKIITNQCRKRTMTRSNLIKIQETYIKEFDQQTALLVQWKDRGLLEEFRKLTNLIKS